MWCVIEGWMYEGESFSSLRLFMREVDARAYEKLLESQLDSSGYVECEFRPVM